MSDPTARAGQPDGPMPREERDLVRELAQQVAEIAAGAANEAIRRRWRDVNALRRPDRAPVWCRPVGCWQEIMPPESLLCRDPWLRGLENRFRQVLFKHEIGDDSPVDAHFAVEAVVDADPPDLWGVEIRRRRSGAARCPRRAVHIRRRR